MKALLKGLKHALSMNLLLCV